jgi:diguanylate cyclase (GGDEF)-like protein
MDSESELESDILIPPGNMDRRVRREQMKLLANLLPVALPGSLLVSVLLVWGFWDVVNHFSISVWLIVLFSVNITRLYILHVIHRLDDQESAEVWLNRVLLLGSGVSGMLWGCVGFLAFNPENPFGFALLVIILGGLVAGSLGSHSYYFPNFVLFSIPAFLPLILHLLLLENDFYTFIGLLMLLFLGMNLFYSKKYSEMAEQSIRLKFSNDVLLHKLRDSNRELQHHSYTDPLTAIGNRRQFDMDFDQTWQVAKTTGVPICLVLMDVDHFKVYNDTYGHPEGDKVLRDIALELLQVCEEHKVRGRPMRIGGEEFALLFKGELPQALQIAEVLRKAIRSMQTRGAVTVSFGVSMAYPAEDESPKMLFQRADEALYQAKDAGRDCVVCAQAETARKHS